MDMKKSLRQLCLEEYGEDFIKDYDKICNGEPVGNIFYSLWVVMQIEQIEKKYRGQYREWDLKENSRILKKKM
jgi:hypothetical protein